MEVLSTADVSVQGMMIANRFGKFGKSDKYGMKFINLIETKNPGYKPGEPYWELDSENKAYTVHQPDGTEIGRHTFQHSWDSSPAMRAAKEDYKIIYGKYYTQKKAADYATAQAKPLSHIENEYYKLSKSVSKYSKYIWPKTPEDDFLDKETKELYMATSTKWLKDMNRMADGGTIRQSLIDGTYKPAA
jgi:hypothetical protein